MSPADSASPAQGLLTEPSSKPLHLLICLAFCCLKFLGLFALSHFFPPVQTALPSQSHFTSVPCRCGGSTNTKTENKVTT